MRYLELVRSHEKKKQKKKKQPKTTTEKQQKQNKNKNKKKKKKKKRRPVPKRHLASSCWREIEPFCLNIVKCCFRLSLSLL